MKIFSIFSNPADDLDGVREELLSLVNSFNTSESKEKVDFVVSVNETVDTITSRLIAEQKDISLILFSGHSANEGLDAQGGNFTASHLVNFLHTLNADKSSIQCVILNGCENEEIVKQLKQIPIVIGTKSKIQDNAAKKFTKDFFNSLIQSESTYEHAFKEAISAGQQLKYSIYDNTRGEGYIDDLDQVNHLNQYFFSKNDDSVANSKFRFKKKRGSEGTKWIKYIAGLLTISAISLLIIFWSDIMGLFSDYSCPDFLDEAKCNILVADFNSSDNMDVNELITEGINSNTLIQPYIESVYAESFSNFIKKNSLRYQDLNNQCNYEYSLTGNVFDKGDHLQFDFDIFPPRDIFEKRENSELKIGDFGELNDMIQNVDLSGANSFIINKLCISCAYSNKELLAIVEQELEKLKEDDQSIVAYQHISNELASVYMHYGDTTKAIKALYRISNAADNDFALRALEEKAILLEKTGNVQKAYKNESDYIKTVERIIENPESGRTKYSKAQYEKASDKMREKRANTVYTNNEELKDKSEEAVEDYKYLKEKESGTPKYDSKIRVLEKVQINTNIVGNAAVANNFSAVNQIKRIEVKGVVLDSKNKAIPNVKIKFLGKTISSNSRGAFSFGSINELNVFGASMGFEAGGFKTRNIKISNQLEYKKIVLKPFTFMVDMHELVASPTLSHIALTQDLNIVKIKNKTWRTINLNTNKYESTCHKIEEQCKKYGRLYNHKGALEACKSLGDGWRLPTNEDWNELIKAFSNTSDPKEAYKALISNGNNKLNFSLGGYNSEGNEKGVGTSGYYWSSSLSRSRTANVFQLNSKTGTISRTNRSVKDYLSCRCVK